MNPTGFLFIILVCTATLFAQKPSTPDTLPAPLGTDTARAPTAKTPQDAPKTAPQSGPLKGAFTGTAFTTPVPDTAISVGNRPYWGLGGGWTLGENYIFTLWQSLLPDSFSYYGLSDSLLGALQPRLALRQHPDAYTAAFPLTLSLTPIVDKTHSIDLEISGFFLSKSMQAALQNDSLVDQILINQSLGFYSFSLGGTYNRALNEEYLKVNNSQRTTISAGLYAIPLALIALKSTYGKTSQYSDSFAPFLPRLTNRSLDARGYGFSFKISGRSVFPVSRAWGLIGEIGYVGTWYGGFTTSGRRLLREDINPQAINPKDAIEFFSSRLLLGLELIRNVHPSKAPVPVEPGVNQERAGVKPAPTDTTNIHALKPVPTDTTHSTALIPAPSDSLHIPGTEPAITAPVH
ncbi:MAG: hypothetical protein PHC61_19020 [Chitinivibrionales bacterium]|nr:hypothetical protein [Chitinivibrionales bacterium]